MPPRLKKNLSMGAIFFFTKMQATAKLALRAPTQESKRESKREKERLTGSFNIDSDMKECVAVIDADTLRRGKAGEIK